MTIIDQPAGRPGRNLGQERQGRAEFADYMAVIQRAFPDFHNKVADVVSEGERSFARLQYTGTHQGELMGIPATGRWVTYAGAALFRFRDEQIEEVWVLGDLYGLLTQLRNDGEGSDR